MLLTQAAALRSGLTRLSFVGPSELYVPIALPSGGSTAPIDSAPAFAVSEAGPEALNGLLKNLYFVGHWTQPGGGITPVIVSAMRVAEQVVARREEYFTPRAAAQHEPGYAPLAEACEAAPA